MTANAISGDKERCLAVGMNDYVSKPVRTDELFAVLSKWLLKNCQEPVPNNFQPSIVRDVIDHKVISDLLGLGENGDANLLRELVEMWLKAISVSLGEVKVATESGSFAKVAFEAHKLRSSCGTLGIIRVSDLTSAIEKAALEANQAELKKLVGELDDSINEAKPQLDVLLRSPLKVAA